MGPPMCNRTSELKAGTTSEYDAVGHPDLIRCSPIIIPTWVPCQRCRLTEYFLACQGPSDRPEKHWKRETPAENDLTIKGKAYIAEIYAHPTQHARDKSTAHP